MLNINNILKILTILLIYALVSSFLEIFYYDNRASLATYREQKEDIHVKFVDDENDLDDDNNGNDERLPVTKATESNTITKFSHTTATKVTDISNNSTVEFKQNSSPSTNLPTTNSLGITNLLDPDRKSVV